ncbi:hypothetical protein BC834DRAFT_326260 [Gloeopeniophorella convolvens]|nr:hypothetical protein BC834DRAFT_326260 [Gloeopeniophorella convolvens]
MSDPNSLEAFYEGLDARMAMPDEDWHSYASRRGKGVEQSAAASFSPTSRRNQVDGDVPMAPRNLTPPLPTPAEETLPPSRKRKASYEEPEPRARLPLSTKRGKHGSSNSNTSKQPSGERVEATKRIETLPPKNTIPEQSVRAPALNANMTSVIEDFTEVVDSPLVKSKTRAAPFVEESSNITTPGKAPAQTSRARSRTAVKQPTIILNSSKFAAAKKGKGKDKPEPVTPEEYARRLMDPPAEIPPEEPQALNSRGRKTREPSIRLPAKEVRLPQYLQDYVIFYAGGDLMYASISTRRKMDIIAKHGGRLLPKFDPTVATHIVTDTSETLTLSALGLKNLSEIPEHIPIVKWTWVNSNQPIKGEKDKQKMEQEFLHSAFRSRVPLTNHGKGKQKADASIKQMPLTSAPWVVVHLLLVICSLCMVAHKRITQTRSSLCHHVLRLRPLMTRSLMPRWATSSPSPLPRQAKEELTK